MTKQKRILYLVSAVLLVLTICFFLMIDGNDLGESVAFVVHSDDHAQTISMWKNDQGEYYVFLPSFADLSDLQIVKDTWHRVYLNGEPVTDGAYCDRWKENIAYDLSYGNFGRIYRVSLTFVRSANVATMFIDTHSKSMEYIHQQKGNAENGEMMLFWPDGSVNYEGIVQSIKGRGNSSWDGYQKKPYNIQLRKEGDLLSLGTAQNWVLLSNAGDPTHLRNRLVFDFAKDLGLQYSPDSEWVDLYLNGEYVGLYLLSERNEAHTNRVDIADTGSFLVSQELAYRDESNNDAYVYTQQEVALRVHYPEILRSHQTQTQMQTLQQIQQTMQSVENALIADDGIDPETKKAWTELIDLESWARKYLVEEISGNSDAGAISQFYYLESSTQKVFAGPVWDYDLSMGNQRDWSLQSPQTFYANRYRFKPGLHTPWFYYLCQKQPFYDLVQEIYREECILLLKSYYEDRIVAYAERISQATKMNSIRWPGEDAAEATTKLVEYMRERVAFLNGVWIEEKTYHRVIINRSKFVNHVNRIAFTGEQLELPALADEGYSHFVGWFDKATDQPFDPTQPITNDTEIYAVWEEITPPDYGSSRLNKYILCFAGLLCIALLWIELWRIRKYR